MAEAYHPPPLPKLFTYSSPANEPVLLAQGAEARLYKTHFLTPSHPAALKIRPSKPYRHPILDRKLTRQRIIQEARCLAKLTKEGVPVPGVLAADWEGNLDEKDGSIPKTGAWILMEWIEGDVVRKIIDKWEKWLKTCQKVDENGVEKVNPETQKGEEEICLLLRKIGNAVGLLHKTGVIHGDLTTSNLMLQPRDSVAAKTTKAENEMSSLEGEIVLIDFGLAGQSFQEEDRAVDLYVLERAFGSSHPRTERLFEKVLEGYGDSFKGAKQVLKKLEAVRLRGRKRSMLG